MPISPKGWFRQAARATLASVLPQKVFLCRGSRRSGSICLTFDDGPHPIHTPRLLDLLAELQVTATFFLIGREAEKYPDIVLRMVDEGHAVGNHSYSHQARGLLSLREVEEEIRHASQVIADIVGSSPTLYRPPNGKLTFRDLWRLWQAKLTTVLWNVDPKDYRKSSAGEVLEWFRSRTLVAGDLVLFHDNHPHVSEVLPELVACARKNKLNFVPVNAWAQ